MLLNYEASRPHWPLNLKLFTNINTQTTDRSAPGNDLSPEMKTYYDKNLIRLAEPHLVHDQFAQKRPIPQGSGKSIEFRRFAGLPKQLTPLVEGVTPDGQNIDVPSLTATISQYGGYVALSDMIELTAIDNVVLEVTEVVAVQAGQSLDTVTREILVGGTNVMFAPAVSGGVETPVLARTDIDETCLLTPQLIRNAVTALRRVNAPAFDGGLYVAIIHPDTANDIMSNEEWIEAQKYTQNVSKIYEGEIGSYGGARFVVSTEAKIFGLAGDGVSVYATMMVAKNAYGVTEVTGGGLRHFVKPKGSAGTADPIDQRSTVGWKATKTAVRLVEPYMIRIEHTTKSYPDQPSN